jgi:kumamolisin
MPDTACVTAKGAAACGWYAGYGTSVSAPMWAGLAAVTKAVRTQNGKPVVDFIASLYNVAAVQGNYVTAFGDVTTGTNGLYSSKAGYDLVTGLGVPKANALVGMLAAQ